jgi:hypothetical protein
MPPGPSAPLPESAQLAASIFLIGDAGAPARSGEPVLTALTELLQQAPDSDFAGVRLVLLDTEWWLTPENRPGPVEGCDPTSGVGVLTAVGQAIAGAGERPVIVAGHHPIESGGPHGGYFPIEDHLFPLRNLNHALWLPLPFIGTLYPAVRGAGVSSADLASGRYRRFRARLDSVFRCHPPMLYAAGHEHGLQLIDRGRRPSSP